MKAIKSDQNYTSQGKHSRVAHLLPVNHNVISTMNLPSNMKIWNNEKHMMTKDYDLSHSVHSRYI